MPNMYYLGSNRKLEGPTGIRPSEGEVSVQSLINSQTSDQTGLIGMENPLKLDSLPAPVGEHLLLFRDIWMNSWADSWVVEIVTNGYNSELLH